MVNGCQIDKYRIWEKRIRTIINKQNCLVCYKVINATEQRKIIELSIGLRKCWWVALTLDIMWLRFLWDTRVESSGRQLSMRVWPCEEGCSLEIQIWELLVSICITAVRVGVRFPAGRTWGEKDDPNPGAPDTSHKARRMNLQKKQAPSVLWAANFKVGPGERMDARRSSVLWLHWLDLIKTPFPDSNSEPATPTLETPLKLSLPARCLKYPIVCKWDLYQTSPC